MFRQMIGGKKKAGLSRSTIRNILAPARGMYNQAIEDGKAHINPAAMMGKHNKKDPVTCSNCRHTEELHCSAGCNQCNCEEFVLSDKKINPLNREETQIMLDKAEKGSGALLSPLPLRAAHRHPRG
jgi:hypothetical protein